MWTLILKALFTSCEVPQSPYRLIKHIGQRLKFLTIACVNKFFNINYLLIISISKIVHKKLIAQTETELKLHVAEYIVIHFDY